MVWKWTEKYKCYQKLFHAFDREKDINLLTLQAKKKMVDKSLKVESLEFKVDSSYFVLSARWAQTSDKNN